MSNCPLYIRSPDIIHDKLGLIAALDRAVKQHCVSVTIEIDTRNCIEVLLEFELS